MTGISGDGKKVDSATLLNQMADLVLQMQDPSNFAAVSEGFFPKIITCFTALAEEIKRKNAEEAQYKTLLADQNKLSERLNKVDQDNETLRASLGKTNEEVTRLGGELLNVRQNVQTVNAGIERLHGGLTGLHNALFRGMVPPTPQRLPANTPAAADSTPREDHPMPDVAAPASGAANQSIVQEQALPTPVPEQPTPAAATPASGIASQLPPTPISEQPTPAAATPTSGTASGSLPTPVPEQPIAAPSTPPSGDEYYGSNTFPPAAAKQGSQPSELRRSADQSSAVPFALIFSALPGAPKSPPRRPVGLEKESRYSLLGANNPPAQKPAAAPPPPPSVPPPQTEHIPPKQPLSSVLGRVGELPGRPTHNSKAAAVASKPPAKPAAASKRPREDEDKSSSISDSLSSSDEITDSQQTQTRKKTHAPKGAARKSAAEQGSAQTSAAKAADVAALHFPRKPVPLTDREKEFQGKIIGAMRGKGFIKIGDLMTDLKVDRDKIYLSLQTMIQNKLVERGGTHTNNVTYKSTPKGESTYPKK